jgi:hypothetical protein
MLRPVQLEIGEGTGVCQWIAADGYGDIIAT